MAHALATFIREQMDQRGLRNRDVVASSGLSRALVSKYATDKRETLSRLPDKATVEGLAKALNVTPDFLLAKAIEALGLGYLSGDFVNSVGTATDRELLDQIEFRLNERRDGGADGGGGTGGTGGPMVPPGRGGGDGLPSLDEARDLRRQRMIEQGQPQKQAGYDSEPDPDE